MKNYFLCLVVLLCLAGCSWKRGSNYAKSIKGRDMVADSAGFILNNEMDDFSVKPGFPNMYGMVGGEINSVQPGKKKLLTVLLYIS